MGRVRGRVGAGEAQERGGPGVVVVWVVEGGWRGGAEVGGDGCEAGGPGWGVGGWVVEGWEGAWGAGRRG